MPYNSKNKLCVRVQFFKEPFRGGLYLERAYIPGEGERGLIYRGRGERAYIPGGGGRGLIFVESLLLKAFLGHNKIFAISPIFSC